MYGKILATAMVSLTLFSCNQGAKTETQKEVSTENKTEQVINHVMTKEQQAALTPDAVLKDLVDGNKRFQSGTTTQRDHREQARKSAPGQFPKAVVTVAQLLFLEILFPKHKISTSFNHF